MEGTGRQETCPRAALSHVGVRRDGRFGSVLLLVSLEDVASAGIAFGDAVSVTFSNGRVLSHLPYLNGYYVGRGEALVLGYPGSAEVEVTVNYGNTLYDDLGLREGDTARIELDEAGCYRALQDTFDLSYSRVRDASATDEEFANFRPLTGGSMREGILWRGASPIDDTYGRAAATASLAEQTGIAFDLDLADDERRARAHVRAAEAASIDTSWFRRLLSEGRVALLGLTAAYPSRQFCSSFARGLTQIAEHEGPYLMHCTEGKDRTGFCCMVLEALCGASLEEMEADYMVTYANYYGITRAGDPARYEAILGLHLHGMLRYLIGTDEPCDLASIDFAPHARRYLARGGMDDASVSRLLGRICR